MKLELKKLKVYPKLSEETAAFTAELWADGRKIADAKNDGHGGGNLYYWSPDSTREGRAALLAHAAAVVPEYSYEQLDVLVSRLMDREGMRGWLRRQCRRKTMFRLPGDKPDSWRFIDREYGPAVAAHVRAKYPGAVIANEDLNKAVELVSTPV